MKTAFSVFISCALVASDFAWAAGDVYTLTPTSNSVYSQTTTTTTVPSATTSTLYHGNNSLDSIKDAGQQAAASSNEGVNMGMTAVGITGAGAAATCGTSNVSGCKFFVAGLVASFAVTLSMAKARNDSVGTVGAVDSFGAPQIGSVGNDKLTGTDGKADPLNSVPSDIASNPNWKTGIQTKQNLEKQGWKLNVGKGTVTTPSGQTLSSSVVNSADSMRSAGASESTIKQIQDAFKKAESQAKATSKAADNSDSFGDLGGGGGGKGAVASATPEFPSPAGGAKLGINRDPAQVAGMKKDYNGSPIGVSGDSLFDMIDRRYQLHQQNGSFISP